MTLLGVISFLNIFFAVCLILSLLVACEFISVGRVVFVFVIRTLISRCYVLYESLQSFSTGNKKGINLFAFASFPSRSYFSHPTAKILSTIEFPKMKSLQLFISTWPAFTWFLLPTHSTCKFSCCLFISFGQFSLILLLLLSQELAVDVSRLCLQSHQPTEEVVHQF